MSDKTELTGPVPEGKRFHDLKKNGQQVAYVVLTQEERAKGFVRPIRRSYRHVGIRGPRYPLRDLTPEQQDRYSDLGYVKFEPYPEGGATTSRFWTQGALDSVSKGCGVVTTMSRSIAETYARDPFFYGSTFCCGCGQHLPVGELGEFVWEGTDDRVGT